MFLGLNGVVVKSHGSANQKGVANAVHVAARLLEEDITRRIADDLANIGTLAADAKSAGGRKGATPPMEQSAK